ncbi:hypothetical protein SMICM304S_02313 [Streptomyces microflavus]
MVRRVRTRNSRLLPTSSAGRVSYACGWLSCPGSSYAKACGVVGPDWNASPRRRLRRAIRDSSVR